MGRNWGRRRAIAVAALAAALVTGVPAVHGAPNAAPDSARAGTRADSDAPPSAARTDIGVLHCPPPSTEERRLARRAAAHAGAPPEVPANGPVRVLVIGDSLGCSVAVGLAPTGYPALEVHQATMIGCGVVSGEVFDAADPFPRNTEDCPELVRELHERAFAQVEPTVVVWASIWERFGLREGGRTVAAGSPEWRWLLQARFEDALGRIADGGAQLVLLTAASPAPAELIGGRRIVSPRFDGKFAVLDRELRRFAARHPDLVTLIDVAEKICPHGPPCPAKVAGVRPRRVDGSHFDPAGSVWLARWMLPKILEAGRRAA